MGGIDQNFSRGEFYKFKKNKLKYEKNLFQDPAADIGILVLQQKFKLLKRINIKNAVARGRKVALELKKIFFS